MTNMLHEALWYAAAFRWAIFPIKPQSKEPATAHGFKDATTDPEQIAAWWSKTDYNIGVDCGRSGLAVIDLDGPEGLAAWDKLQASIAPRMCMVQITGSGGSHLIYRQPALVSIKNTAGKLAKHIDTRGEGGYILLAPSIHPNGNAYAWHPDADTDHFDDMETFPPELLPLLQDQAHTPPSAPTQAPRNPSRTLQRAYERIANAPQGTRNDTLNKAAFYLFNLAKDGLLSELDARDTLTAAAQRAGLNERETTATIQSAYKGAYAG